MPRRGGVLTFHIPLFQLRHAQMRANFCHGPASRLMALQTICFASPRESPCNVESISRKPYDWLSVSAFVSPASGETFWYVSNGVSKEFFAALRETFAREAEAGRIILRVCDNAGGAIASQAIAVGGTVRRA